MVIVTLSVQLSMIKTSKLVLKAIIIVGLIAWHEIPGILLRKKHTHKKKKKKKKTTETPPPHPPRKKNSKTLTQTINRTTSISFYNNISLYVLYTVLSTVRLELVYSPYLQIIHILQLERMDSLLFLHKNVCFSNSLEAPRIRI